MTLRYNTPEEIMIYNLVMLANPDADIHTLSNILYEKRDRIREITGYYPALQRTPFGFFCEELRDYKSRLELTHGNSENIRETLFKHLIDELEKRYGEKNSKLMMNLLEKHPERLLLPKPN